MSQRLVRVGPDETLPRVAQLLVDNRIHRVLVTENDRLIVVVTALDLARLMANGRVRAAD